MSLTPELMRASILEALKREPRTQYVSLQGATAMVAGGREYPVEAQPYGRPPELHLDDRRRFREAV